MTAERDKIIPNCDRMNLQLKGLFTEAEQALFKHDPIGIAYIDHGTVADNPDEYAPEIGTILPRLATTKSADEVTDIVYEEFLRWFNDEETVGPKIKYEALSAEIGPHGVSGPRIPKDHCLNCPSRRPRQSGSRRAQLALPASATDMRLNSPEEVEFSQADGQAES